MAVRSYVMVAGTVLVALSCSRAPATSSPSPGTGPAASPGGGRGAPTTSATAPGGAPTRRVPPSRDSLAKLRASYVATVMQSIAGHENEPADRVFKNVQVLKGITAAQLVRKMDKEYGEQL